MNFGFNLSFRPAEDLLRRLKVLPPEPQPPAPPPPSPVAPATASISVMAAPAPALAPSGGLRLSLPYAGLLGRMEGIKGAVPGKIGRWTWYFDSVGVPTLGYGHALHHPVTGEILKRAIHGAATSDLANQAMVKYYGSTDIDMAQVLALKTMDMQNYADAAALHIRTSTKQDEFDMLVDFAYNVGEHSLETSTLLRLHNAGGCPIGPLDPATMAANSRGKVAIHTISDAFTAWSNADHAWSLGVFHRRCVEVFVYSGMDYNAAYDKAFAYHGG